MKKNKHLFWPLIGFLVIANLIYHMGRRALTDYFLQSNAKHIKAVVINEKNYRGNQKVNPEYSYSYMFTLNGKTYTGKTQDPSRNVGDTVEVEYVEFFPVFNRALHRVF